MHTYSAGKDIMVRLLDKSESRRLGSQSGASQVKQHKWFGKMNWGLLRNMTPPVRVAVICMEENSIADGQRNKSSSSSKHIIT